MGAWNLCEPSSPRLYLYCILWDVKRMWPLAPVKCWPHATSHSSWLLGTAAQHRQSLIQLLMQSHLSAGPWLIMHNKEQGEKTELLFLFLWLKVSHKLYIPSKTSESFEYQITLHEMKHSMLWLLKNWRMLSENVLFYKCRIIFLKLTLKCPVGHQTHWNFKPTEEHSRRKERDIYNIFRHTYFGLSQSGDRR